MSIVPNGPIYDPFAPSTELNFLSQYHGNKRGTPLSFNRL